MNDLFSAILSPVAPGVFFDRYWAREHLNISRSASGYYDEFLCSEDIDLYLQSEHLPAAFFNVVSKGAGIPLEEWSHIHDLARGAERVAQPERLYKLFREGATLILNQAHYSMPKLALACRRLTGEMGFPVRANIYISPQNARGFGLHSDAHEVMVLQISGCKSFSLYPGGAPEVQVDLHAGDLLYLPRGLVHKAASRDVASIHLSLGFHTPYAFDLIEELALLAREHPAFQRPLPRESADDALKRAFHAEFTGELERLLSETTAEILEQRRFRALVENQFTGWPGRFSDLIRIPQLTLETVLKRRSSVLVTIEADAKSLHVCFAGNRITVPIFLKSCLDRVLGDSPFAIRELQGLISDSGKLELMASFVKTGLLSIIKM